MMAQKIESYKVTSYVCDILTLKFEMMLIRKFEVIFHTQN